MAAPPPTLPAPPFAPPRTIDTAPPWTQITSNIILFLLIASFAASTDYMINAERRGQVLRGVAIAMVLQFVMLPFVGFCVVRLFSLGTTYGIMLQVMTSCPGGAYSNWWCSLLNADLLLSVTSTAVATVLSAGLMPLNLLIYLNAAYDGDVLQSFRFDQLMVTIALVITAVSTGVIASACLFKRIARNPLRARQLCGLFGNLCGFCLITFSFIFSSVNEPIWDREGVFYAATATPPVCALVLASVITAIPALSLSLPSRCAITVECAFQNIGIGLAASLSLFRGDEAAKAAGVPLFYGLVQTVLVCIFLVTAWQLGCTFAPKEDSFCLVLRKSYQPHGDAPETTSSGAALAFHEVVSPSAS